MARRTFDVDGETWKVYPSGRVTVYDRDEFGLVFEKGTGPDRVRRVTRFSPLGARRRDQALTELSEARLLELFRQSQPAGTSPETCYDRAVR
jgi:hypothetical protein